VTLEDLVPVGAPPSEIRPKATAAARKPIELDPELAGAHAILAVLRRWLGLNAVVSSTH
jgi:hypothetical protein